MKLNVKKCDKCTLPLMDFEGLYRSLFDNAEVYAPGREGSVAVILNEHQYHSNFRIDKEINISSALAKIIEIKKPQVI